MPQTEYVSLSLMRHGQRAHPLPPRRRVHEAAYWDNAQAYEAKITGWAPYLRDAGQSTEAISQVDYRHIEDFIGYD